MSSSRLAMPVVKSRLGPITNYALDGAPLVLQTSIDSVVSRLEQSGVSDMYPVDRVVFFDRLNNFFPRYTYKDALLYGGTLNSENHEPFDGKF